MKLIRTLLSFAGISLLATSCASFSGNELPKVANKPAANVKKVPITYTLKAGSNMAGGQTEFAEADRAKIEKPMVDAFNKSERFSSVSQGKGGGVHVDVDVRNDGNAAAATISGFITGASFLTIPGFATDHYKLTATARTASGQTRRYELNESVTTVIWLPLIVATPFAHPSTTIPKAHENMYRNLMVNMERDGLLTKAAN